MERPKPLVLVIDGVIGAGKTVLIEVLRAKLPLHGLRVTVVKEPVDRWHESGILKRFYTDTSRWAYHFQTMAFHDRVMENVEMYEKHAHETDVFILERSPFTDPLFMEILHDSGKVDDLEMDNYQKWWKLWYKVMPYQPSAFVYLKPSLGVCMDRLRARDRDGEQGVNIDYQRALEEKHDLFFKDPVKISEECQVPCLVYATDENFKSDELVKDKIANDIFIFLGVINEQVSFRNHSAIPRSIREQIRSFECSDAVKNCVLHILAALPSTHENVVIKEDDGDIALYWKVYNHRCDVIQAGGHLSIRVNIRSSNRPDVIHLLEGPIQEQCEKAIEILGKNFAEV